MITLSSLEANGKGDGSHLRRFTDGTVVGSDGDGDRVNVNKSDLSSAAKIHYVQYRSRNGGMLDILDNTMRELRATKLPNFPIYLH